VALHSLGRGLNPGQQLELLAAPLETRFAPTTAIMRRSPGETRYACHIQFPIARTAALMAMQAHLTGPLDGDQAQHR
jgi:hypothetical protein